MNVRDLPNRIHHRVDRLRWKLASGLVPRRCVQARGLTLTLQCDNRLTHFRWASYTTKEPETLDWLDTHVTDDGVLFDVGANIGVYSLYAALRHPSARVIAFEPEYANLHLLRDNIVLNALGARIETYSIALGDRTGLSRLHLADLTPGAALHTEATDRPSTTEAGERVVWTEGVWAMTVDEFCADHGVWPTAIKIDVDGGEARVLAGAQKALAMPKLRAVIVEIGSDAEATCAGHLEAAGLTRVAIDRAGGAGNQVWARKGTT